MTGNKIARQGCVKHAALAQLHRWYQIYENPETSLANQLDILVPQVRLKSGLGEAVGHDAYVQRIAQLPKTWKNAHFVRGATVVVDDDGAIHLEAALTYLNQGMRPDGSVRSADLLYTTTLAPAQTLLPKFSQVEIKQLGEDTAPEFKEAYPENRLLSLLHYWLALVEDPQRRLEPFSELLADPFDLAFSNGRLTDFKAFEQWFRGPALSAAAGTHEISGFSCEVIDRKTWHMQVDLAWQGILPDDQAMAGKTRHRWTVADAAQERFARIKTVAVEVLQPLTPIR
jgi:hypothetical protein